MRITQKKSRELGKFFKIDYKKTPFREWWIGLNIETEHSNIFGNDKKILGKIVISHLNEHPRYYKFLQEMEEKFE